jgi:4-hydroxybenzoate polyprenyltransferase
MKYLRLIRVQNLLIIALTMYLMRYCILKPLLEYNDFQLQLSSLHFFLLVLSTILLTAAGYIINDYYDVEADNVNHPEKVIIGKTISLRTAMNFYIVTNLLGVILGVYIGSVIHVKAVGLAFLMVAGLLWFYSTSYKGLFIVGNLMVSLFAGLVPLMVLLFELPLLNAVYKIQLWGRKLNFNYLISWIVFYAIFAFILTLIREIIKDAEDFEGDKAYGQETLPVKAGIRVTKISIVTLIALMLAILIIVVAKFLADPITFVYLVAFVIAPLIFLAYKIIKAEDKKDYHQSSTLSKIIMLAGIFYALVAKYLIIYN